MEFTKTTQNLSRRVLLQTGTVSAVSTMLGLRALGQVAGAATSGGEDDYKALVFVFLAGGNDSFNLLVPGGAETYEEYRTSRGSLALPMEGEGALLPIQPDGDNESYALHPSARELADLFRDGELSFVANVGTLIEPSNSEQYRAGTVELPSSLYSHNDQAIQWQTSQPGLGGSARTGWAGRMADLLHSSYNGEDAVSMGISVSGTNLLQSGSNGVAYSIGPHGSVGLHGDGSAAPSWKQARAKALRSVLEQDYDNLFEQAFVDRTRFSLDQHEKFSQGFSKVELGTSFGPVGHRWGGSLEAVAKTIAAHRDLGMRRQTFFVQLGDWDHHNNLLRDHGAHIGNLSRGIGQFWKAIKEIGMAEQVVLSTGSDFGRGLSSNGRGSDHGWGGNQFVVGGPVRGRRIFGTYPRLRLGEGQDIGDRGRLLPSTSTDEYFAELALWFGVPPGDLPLVLPNVRNFFDPEGNPPLGMMKG